MSKLDRTYYAVTATLIDSLGQIEFRVLKLFYEEFHAQSFRLARTGYDVNEKHLEIHEVEAPE